MKFKKVRGEEFDQILFMPGVYCGKDYDGKDIRWDYRVLINERGVRVQDRTSQSNDEWMATVMPERVLKVAVEELYKRLNGCTCVK